MVSDNLQLLRNSDNVVIPAAGQETEALHTRPGQKATLEAGEPASLGQFCVG